MADKMPREIWVTEHGTWRNEGWKKHPDQRIEKYHHDDVVKEKDKRIAELEEALEACGQFMRPDVNEDYLKERGHMPDETYSKAVDMFYKALQKKEGE
jgi:hypothetical protein